MYQTCVSLIQKCVCFFSIIFRIWSDVCCFLSCKNWSNRVAVKHLPFCWILSLILHSKTCQVCALHAHCSSILIIPFFFKNRSAQLHLWASILWSCCTPYLLLTFWRHFPIHNAWLKPSVGTRIILIQSAKWYFPCIETRSALFVTVWMVSGSAIGFTPFLLFYLLKVNHSNFNNSRKCTLCCIVSIFHDKANFKLLHGPVTNTLQKRHKLEWLNILTQTRRGVCVRINYQQLPLCWIVLFNLENSILSQFVSPWMDTSSSIR